MPRSYNVRRGHVLLSALRAVRALASGQWTVDELAIAIEEERRTTYRIIETIHAVGIPVRRLRAGRLVRLSVAPADVSRALLAPWPEVRPYGDLVGRTFGRWTVIGSAAPRRYGGGSQARWRCRCECGIERDVFQAQLFRGTSTQCRRCGYTLRVYRARKEANGAAHP